MQARFGLLLSVEESAAKGQFSVRNSAAGAPEAALSVHYLHRRRVSLQISGAAHVKTLDLWEVGLVSCYESNRLRVHEA